MNTIETIRAEVLRLIKESDCSQWGLGKMSACNRILNFLDTLQEQPVCEMMIRLSYGELLPNLTTTEQWRRLVASGLPQVTYTLASLWNIIHGMDCIYEFDNTMAADELIEELVSIIELEACAKKQNTES